MLFSLKKLSSSSPLRFLTLHHHKLRHYFRTSIAHQSLCGPARWVCVRLTLRAFWMISVCRANLVCLNHHTLRLADASRLFIFALKKKFWLLTHWRAMTILFVKMCFLSSFSNCVVRFTRRIMSSTFHCSSMSLFFRVGTSMPFTLKTFSSPGLSGLPVIYLCPP